MTRHIKSIRFVLLLSFAASPAFANNIQPNNTFFKNGVFTPGYGEISLSSGAFMGRKPASLPSLKAGWQLFKFPYVVGTFGYATIGFQQAVKTGKDGISEFKTNYHGFTFEVFGVPEFDFHFSIWGMPSGSSAIRYKDAVGDVQTLKADVKDFAAYLFYRIDTNAKVALAFGSRSVTINEATPALFDEEKKSDSYILLGVRGSLL